MVVVVKAALSRTLVFFSNSKIDVYSFLDLKKDIRSPGWFEYMRV